jgi:diguanylate cyclase (GGDEF)-like protein/PAS domain S-box-containing protein
VDLKESLADRLQVGVIIAGAHSRIVRYVNTTASEILGRKPDEVLGRSWRCLVSQADYKLFTYYERRVIRNGPDGSVERVRPFMMRFSRPNGDIAHVRVVSTLSHEFMDMFGNDEPHLVIRLEDLTGREQIPSAIRLALDHGPMSISLVDHAGRVVFSTQGHSPQETEDSIDAETTSVFEAFADYPEPLAMLGPAFRGEASAKVIHGYGRYFDFHVIPIADANGRIRLAAALATDVTDRELARASQALLAHLAEQALVTREPVDLWQRAVTLLADQLGAAATVHEIGAAGATSNAPTLAASAGPPVPSQVAEAVLAAATQDGRTAQAPDLPGGWRTLAAPVGRPGACAAVVAVYRSAADADPFTDRDEEFLVAAANVLGSAAARLADEREIRHRSTHDALTDLPNRSSLLDRLTRTLERHRTGVIFIDLDDFKAINDTYGHQAGDQLLREVARRLRAAVRPDDLVARLAGDEFAILCERVDNPETVERLAQRILTAIGEPVTLGEVTVRISASAGVAISHADLTDPDRLLNASDIAMYTAKRDGTGLCVVHDSWMHL